MNQSNHRILMSVVTRDRENCLEKFINLALQQTLKPTNIIVIDNDSQASTRILVEKYMESNAHLIYLNTNQNEGSAGGQSIALTYAAANNYDLVYTMDDDCEPAIDALEKVYLKWLKTENKENTILSSVALSLTSEQFSFALWKLKNNIFSKGNQAYWEFEQILDNEKIDDIFWGWSHFFLGVLIPVGLIKKYGTVNPKYFIRGDELEYFVRLKEFGVKMGAVLTSILRHPQELPNQTNAIKLYYTIRNNTEIRVKYYPSLKYNKYFYRFWLFINKNILNKNNITTIAIADAINGNFSKKPSDIQKLKI